MTDIRELEKRNDLLNQRRKYDKKIANMTELKAGKYHFKDGTFTTFQLYRHGTPPLQVHKETESKSAASGDPEKRTGRNTPDKRSTNTIKNILVLAQKFLTLKKR